MKRGSVSQQISACEQDLAHAARVRQLGLKGNTLPQMAQMKYTDEYKMLWQDFEFKI